MVYAVVRAGGRQEKVEVGTVVVLDRVKAGEDGTIQLTPVLHVDGDTVTTGAVVTVLYDGDNEPEQLLVGSIEEQRDGLTVVSPGSPLGEALLGSTPGDKVSFEAPGGTLTASVISIDD